MAVFIAKSQITNSPPGKTRPENFFVGCDRHLFKKSTSTNPPPHVSAGIPTAMFHKIDYPFLIGAFVSFVTSVSLWFLVSHDYGLFVGIWVPSILSLWVGVRVVILSAGIQTRKDS